MKAVFHNFLLSAFMNADAMWRVRATQTACSTCWRERRGACCIVMEWGGLARRRREVESIEGKLEELTKKKEGFNCCESSHFVQVFFVSSAYEQIDSALSSPRDRTSISEVGSSSPSDSPHRTKMILSNSRTTASNAP